MNRLLIVEDMPEAQDLLQDIAREAFDSVQMRCTSCVAEALTALQHEDYDLALIDLVLPDGTGVDVIAAAAQRRPECTLVVASLFDDDEHLFPALRAGAHGYLLKDQPTEVLAGQLRGISAGHPPLSPAIARRMLDYFREASNGGPQIAESAAAEEATLTPREREVLGQLARGISIANIALAMSISRHTVGDHVKNIYRKLNISSRAEAALRAKNLGLA